MDEHEPLEPEIEASEVRGEWATALDFRPIESRFGVMQVLGAVGARSWEWISRIHREHFADSGGDAIGFLWALRRLGHLIESPSVAGDGDAFRIRPAELVFLPLLTGPDGERAFWLRGGFDWWRLASREVAGARWQVVPSLGREPPRVTISASIQAIRSFCEQVGARIVDPRRHVLGLSRSENSDIMHGASAGLDPERGNWEVFLPWSPDRPHAISFTGQSGDWGLHAVFGEGHFIAALVRIDEDQTEKRYWLMRLTSRRVFCVREIRGEEVHRMRRWCIRKFWADALAPRMLCDQAPAAYFDIARHSLFEPHQASWPIELCAALSAFSGRLPTKCPIGDLHRDARRLQEAIDRGSPPAWEQGARVVPVSEIAWRFEHVPHGIARHACSLLGWKTMEK
jgi:hypothetical protein